MIALALISLSMNVCTSLGKLDAEKWLVVLWFLRLFLCSVGKHMGKPKRKYCLNRLSLASARYLSQACKFKCDLRGIRTPL